MKIRFKRSPDPAEFGEFDVRSFRPGDVIDVSARLATLLIISGDAEPVGGPWDRAEAPDAPARPKKPKPEIL